MLARSVSCGLSLRSAGRLPALAVLAVLPLEALDDIVGLGHDSLVRTPDQEGGS